MAFRNFRANIALRVLLFVAIAGTLAYCLVAQLYLRSTYVAIALAISVVEFIHYVERTNRDFTSFLSSLSQNDFTTTYAEKGKGKTFDDLYTIFNQITNKFRAISEDKEAQFIFLSLLVEHVRVGILGINGTGQIHLINQTMRDYLANTTAKDLAGLSHEEKEIADVFRGIKVGENRLVKKMVNGKIVPLTILAAEIRIQGQYYKLISAQDIHHELEANELEAWQKLIRVLTHEIMNSISPIISLSETLHQMVNRKDKSHALGANDMAVVQKGLEAIRLRGHGLQHFANAYRSITRIPQPQFRKVQVAGIIDRLATLFREELDRKGIGLETSSKKVSHELLADPELLEQVLINLIRNAIDALAGRPLPWIKILAEAMPSQTTVIYVKDNGHGIDADKLDKVFIPFFTTKKTGSGIGLALSKQIVQLHGGQISIASNAKGTTVEVRL